MSVLSRWFFIFVPVFLLLIGCGSDSQPSKNLPETIVTIPNALPSIQAEDVIIVQFDKKISLVAEGSDTDGEIISYLWSQTGGADVELSNSDSSIASFQPEQALSEDTEYLFEIQVIDNGQGSLTKSVKVQVKGLLLVIQSEVLKSCIISQQETNGWVLTKDILQLDCHAINLEELGYLTSLKSLNLEFSVYNFQIDDPENLVDLQSVTVSCDIECYISPIFAHIPSNTPFNINPLSKLPNLLDLTLSYLEVDEVSLTSNFETLTSLNLRSVRLTSSDKNLFTHFPQITNLRVSNNGYTVHSLDTIDFSAMPNLIEVYLPSIKIKDVLPLGGLLELESLTLNTYQLNDISPLSGLNKLTYLKLACNELPCVQVDNFHWNTLYKAKGILENVSAIENLTQLQELNISNNITKSLDLSQLTKLQTVNLSNNRLQQINFAIDNELSSVNLDGNRLTGTEFMNHLDSDVQFSAFRNFFSCEALELQQTDIDVSRISCLSEKSNFDHVKVKDDYLLNCLYPMINDETNENIDSITCGVGLGSAGVTEYSISSLEGISQFSNLKDFKTDNDAMWSEVVSLAPLAEISTLTRLSIDSHKITDISPLQGLHSLEVISLPYVENPDIDVFLSWDTDHPINCIAMKLTEDEKQLLFDHFSELTIEDYRCYFED